MRLKLLCILPYQFLLLFSLLLLWLPHSYRGICELNKLYTVIEDYEIHPGDDSSLLYEPEQRSAVRCPDLGNLSQPAFAAYKHSRT